MDWNLRFLEALRASRPSWEEPPRWQAALALYHGLSPAEAADLDAAVLRMIDEEYHNPHSSRENLPFDDVMVNLPAGMTPEDLLCIEAAVLVAAERGLGEGFFALNRLMRAPRWHAMYPRLHWLGYQGFEVQRRLGLTRAGRGLGALLGAAVGFAQAGIDQGPAEMLLDRAVTAPWQPVLQRLLDGEPPPIAAPLRDTGSFEECLALSLEQDPAAAPLAGALAGAAYGPAAIPRRWTQPLRDRAAIEEAAEDLYAAYLKSK